MNELSRFFRQGFLRYGAIVLALFVGAGAATAQVNNVFTRGNVNDDFKVNWADADYLYAYLNLGGPAPLCMDAADVDDNGVVDGTDYLMLQDYLMGVGPEPAEPFPNRGWDPSPDALTCLYPTPAFPGWPGSPSDNISVCVAVGSQ